MNSAGKRGLLKLAGGVALVFIVTGCAGPLQTRGFGSGPGVPAGARLSIIAAEEDGPPVDAATHRALAATLTRAGFSVGDDGAYMVDFSLAERPATMGVTPGKTERALSAAKGRKPLQSCQDRTHRFTLVILDRKTGETAYRGDAEEHHCRATLDDSRPHLIDAVVADLKQPKGVYELSRPGKK